MAIISWMEIRQSSDNFPDISIYVRFFFALVAAHTKVIDASPLGRLKRFTVDAIFHAFRHFSPHVNYSQMNTKSKKKKRKEYCNEDSQDVKVEWWISFYFSKRNYVENFTNSTKFGLLHVISVYFEWISVLSRNHLFDWMTQEKRDDAEKKLYSVILLHNVFQLIQLIGPAILNQYQFTQCRHRNHSHAICSMSRYSFYILTLKCDQTDSSPFNKCQINFHIGIADRHNFFYGRNQIIGVKFNHILHFSEDYEHWA